MRTVPEVLRQLRVVVRHNLGYTVTDVRVRVRERPREWLPLVLPNEAAKDKPTLSPAARKLLSAAGRLREKGSLTCEELAREAGLDCTSYVRSALAFLRKEGLLSGEPGEPGYALTEAGASALS